MNAETVNVSLPAGGCLTIEGGAGFAISVQQGEVWITTKFRRDDLIARAGIRAILAADGNTVVSAFEASSVAVTAPPECGPVTLMLRHEGSRHRLTISRAPVWLSTVIGSCLRMAA